METGFQSNLLSSSHGTLGPSLEIPLHQDYPWWKPLGGVGTKVPTDGAGIGYLTSNPSTVLETSVPSLNLMEKADSLLHSGLGKVTSPYGYVSSCFLWTRKQNKRKKVITFPVLISYSYWSHDPVLAAGSSRYASKDLQGTFETNGSRVGFTPWLTLLIFFLPKAKMQCWR